MQWEVTSLYDLEVFTHKGLILGRVSEVIIDINKNRIYELILSDTNPNIVEGSRSIGIPYRWIQSVSEVIVLKYFPGKIHIKPRLRRYRHRRLKLRVVKHSKSSHGVSRHPWQGPRKYRRR
jgi:sporulation protein YlmC with PRC-barrel domain